MAEINDIRFTATREDLERWEWFFKEMEKRGLITIYEISKLYPMRGESKLIRKYFKVKLNAERES
ncbi:MAG: hypothetical protein AAFX46_12490 [Cyanobacteria bacterium J06636_27]